MKTILPKELMSGVRHKPVVIHWPTEEEMEGVSKQLKQISQIGMSSEASGNYFISGDLAYQLQEIMRTTSELLKTSLKKSLSRKGQ